MRRQFASDNCAGYVRRRGRRSPRPIRATRRPMATTNYTARASDLIREFFETDCEVFFTFNGTAANSLALAGRFRWHLECALESCRTVDTPAIITESLSKTYGGRAGIRDLALTIRAGEIYGFLGPNGAGKTTTIRLLLGLLRPTSGAARVLGRDAWRESPAIKAETGYIPGDLRLYAWMTARSGLKLVSSVRRRRPPRPAAGRDHRVQPLPLGDDRRGDDHAVLHAERPPGPRGGMGLRGRARVSAVELLGPILGARRKRPLCQSSLLLSAAAYSDPGPISSQKLRDFGHAGRRDLGRRTVNSAQAGHLHDLRNFPRMS